MITKSFKVKTSKVDAFVEDYKAFGYHLVSKTESGNKTRVNLAREDHLYQVKKLKILERKYNYRKRSIFWVPIFFLILGGGGFAFLQIMGAFPPLKYLVIGVFGLFVLGTLVSAINHQTAAKGKMMEIVQFGREIQGIIAYLPKDEFVYKGEYYHYLRKQIKFDGKEIKEQ